MSVWTKIIENGPNRVENRPFGLKQRPNEPNRLSGPIRTTPEAKNGPNFFLLKENGPGGLEMAVACPGFDSQDLATILDPFRAIFADLGPDHLSEI